jgi:hypothetical protein
MIRLTVRSKPHVVMEPPDVVAVLVTCVVPIGKSEPEAGAVLRVPQVPLTPVGAKLTVAPHTPGSASVLKLAGQVSVQAWTQQAGVWVVMVSCQPPLIFPTSPLASSTT